ncbi:MAG: hypothetical protein IH621_10375 [Krumholzibacteria bacterium]|nr:hypothetical protein [Candidatus Krumholzibacteria bacterium]
MKTIALGTILAVVLGCGWAQAAVITVDAGGGGDYLTIGAAVAAALPDDEIVIAAGTYREQLFIDKDLTLTGAGAGLTVVEAPDPLDRTTYAITSWTGTSRTIDPVIGVVGAAVTITGLTVDGRDTGPDNFYGIHFHGATGAVTHCTVDNVTHPTAPGAQQVVSLAFTHGAAGGPYAVTVSDNAVPIFQKGGILVMGPQMVFTVERNQVSAEPTGDIAGNGIQLSYGATGTTAGNAVTGVGYTGEGWAGTGILLFECGDVTMTGDSVTGSQSGVNYSDWRWVHDHPVPVNLTFQDLTLTGNEWSFGTQLSGTGSDLNLVMDGCTITGSTGDAVDVWGTGIDPWGGSVYTGWDDGDLDVTITGLVVDGTAIDGIWAADLSGNATNTVHGFSVTGSSFTNTTGSAVANLFAATIDAPLNYWGDAGGPIVGAKSGGTRPGAPLTAPAGFDLPKSAPLAEVPAAAADKAAETVTGPVAFSPWYGLPLGSVPMTWGTNTSIGEVIGLAGEGDTIVVGPGTYAESLNLNKGLTLLGANAGVHPAVGTHPTETVGARGPETILSTTHAIVPAADGITVDGFMFTGAGGRIVDTYADADGFHLTNCIFDNPAVATTQGVIQFGGGSHVDLTIDFNLFMDQGDHTIYTAGGPYDRLDISWNRFNVVGESLFWAASPLVDGVFQGNELDGTIGGVPGVGFCTVNAGQLGNVQILDNWCHDLQYTPFQVGVIGGTIAGNTIERIHPFPGYYGYGLQLWGGRYGTAVSRDVAITDNVFSFNDVPGTAFPVHGVDLSMPEAPDPGIDGTTIVMRGNQFLDGGVLSGPLAVQHRGDTTLWVDAIGNDWGSVSGPYHATLNPTGTGAPVGDFVTFEPWLGQAVLGVVPTVSGPLACGAPLSLTFQYTADEATPDLFLYNLVVRVPPQLFFNAVVDEEPFGPTNKYFFVQDNLNGTWTFTGSTVANPSSPLVGPGTFDLFTINFQTTAEGTGDVVIESFALRDPANAQIAAAASGATVSVDCTPPAAVTNIAAAPGHNKIDVTWDHDGVGVDHYEVFVAVWGDGSGGSAYPEYDDLGTDVIPARPVNYLSAVLLPAWVPLAPVTTTSLTQAWPDHLSRGVYTYEVFAVDEVGNASPRATANDRATNYWLGDVYSNTADDYTPNGLVNTFDVNYLAASFGDPVPHGDPKGVLDVGPTDDWSRLGIPLTDSRLDFEDLMVFSMNFGVVSAAKAKAPDSDRAVLAWVDYGDGLYGLRLEDGPSLKGLRVTAGAGILAVEAGALLDQQGEPTFLRNLGTGLDASVAVMGVDNPLRGTGDLLVVRADGPIAAADLLIDARATDNSKLEVSLEQASGTLTPRVFALHPNYPNPFNPLTKISFSLPESQPVRLQVYAVDGRRVATLVDEVRGPGLHEVLWNGQDDAGRRSASGVYFCRIDAGPYSQVRKMTLMK